MNRDLHRLADWANELAHTDDDLQARPLWAQIAREVGTYLDETEHASQTGADLFGAES